MDIAPFIAGFLVAMLVSLTGVGGGAVMTPVLILGLGVPVPVAIGTDLLYVAATKAGALVLHMRAGQVRWDVARRLLSGSLPAALLVLGGLAVMDWGSGLQETLSTALAVALLLTAIAILFREPLRNAVLPVTFQASPWVLVAVGALLGVLVTLTSVGAGALGAMLLMLLLPRLRAREIVATDLAQALPLSLMAGLGHLALGHVDLVLLGKLLLGAAPGVLAGGWLSGVVAEALLRRMLVMVLIGVSVLLVV